MTVWPNQSGGDSQKYEALRRSEELFRGVFVHASTGLALTAMDGTVVQVNPRLGQMLGYDVDELRTRFPSLELADEHGQPPADLARLLSGEIPSEQRERRYRHRDGREVWALVSTSIIRDDAGNPLGLLDQLQDITEYKALQARLHLADRLASVGHLAAGVAHEVNNPLSYVVGNLAYLGDELRRLHSCLSASDLSELMKVVREAQEGAERVRLIVRDLQTFSRADEERMGPVDLLHVLDAALGIVGNELRHRARLVRQFDPLPRIVGNEGRLSAAFVNLLLNAVHAIPEGDVDGNTVTVRTFTDDTGRAVVEIQDTGRGIPASQLRRIFDPFFTTKPVGSGIGLGLSLCHGIITMHHGEIAVASKEGIGSTFRVVLPASGPFEDTEAPGGRVLVVDDERLIVQMVQRLLGQEHEVVGLTSPKEALALLEAGERFDLILCDLMMPELTGMDFFVDVGKLDPAQAERTLFLTGGTFTPRAREFARQLQPGRRIDKPFDPVSLRRVVRERISGK